MMQKRKKLRTKTARLINYFLDSNVYKNSNRRKSRKIKSKKSMLKESSSANPTYLKTKKRGKFRKITAVNKGPLMAPGRAPSTNQDHNEHTTPQNKAHDDDNTTDAKETAEGPEHVQDRIKTLLDRAVTLAATEHETDAHREELNAINNEVKEVEKHLNEVQSQLATLSWQEPTRRGPIGLKEMLEYMPPDIRENLTKAKLLKETIDTIKRLLPMFAAEVREYAGMCGESEDLCAYSHGLAFQLFKISSAHFPEVNGLVYNKTITQATSDYTPQAPPCDYAVTLIDYGAELYHYAIRDGITEHANNMHPMATAITHTLMVQVNKRFVIIDEEKRELLIKILMEPARCFFIALGKATNQNPVLLQSAFRARAQEFAEDNPRKMRMGSLTRDPLLSLLRYGEYVDHTILLTIFPESLKDYRIVVYTSSWGPKESPNVINAISYQAKETNPVKVATIYLEANHHYTNILDNSGLERIPVIRAVPLETPDVDITLTEFSPVNAPSKPMIDLHMRDKIREESIRMTELIPTAKYSQTLANIMATRVTKVWKYTEDHQQHLFEGKGPKHIDLGFNLYGMNEHQEKTTQQKPSRGPNLPTPICRSCSVTSKQTTGASSSTWQLH